ncbi:MAG: pantetheine-phosphate adenylyltransferase [Chloroflexota bacterium]|jgi:pantetheine-phosphate adenylyltransferase|nr:pantetheine-phosphate adenylyltransferase [Dehalococcoidia bacterium]MDW8046770.1 pantetheine-phosphate adenylyltransferase [Chloroflexota bacterium]
MRIAVFPGGFDPVTNGHLDLVKRMTHLFDRVIVAVVKGREKGSLFSWEERIEMFRKAVEDLPNVEVEGFDEMTVDFARRKGAVAIVRGIRAVSDFEAEFDMAMMNRKMAPHLESVYLMASQDFLYISASRIREVARLGYDVKDLVPPHVRTALRRRFGFED